MNAIGENSPCKLKRNARVRAVCPLLLLLSTLSLAASDNKHGSSVAKTATNDSYAPFLINNILTSFGNNGDGAAAPNGLNLFEWPKGSGKDCLFEEGIMWGGYSRGELQVGGSEYRHGLQAGRIITSGTSASAAIASNPTDPHNRIYRVRPDINPSTSFLSVRAKIHEETVLLATRYMPTTDQQIYDQYVADWREWPASEGAPFEDRNGNGTYEWETDIPGQPGADQTLWYVANDLDSSRVVKTIMPNPPLPSPRPIGLEMQRTIWGYRNAGWLDNVLFQRTMLINKSGWQIDSMYLAQWADPDLGDAGDDRCGCDTIAQMAYVYNGRPFDDTYEFSPPAFGTVLLQGPIVPSPGGTATFAGQLRAEFANLAITCFPFMGKNMSQYSDPYTQVTWYRALQGRNPSTGDIAVDPLTGKTTSVVFPGDPVTGTGWIHTPELWPHWDSYDTRFLASSGPFTFGVGDTQEVVYAHVVAQGSDNLKSITALRERAKSVTALFHDNFKSIPPAVTAHVAFPSESQATVIVNADCRRQKPAAVSATLLAHDGSIAAEVSLFDDGSHTDSLPGDMIWGNAVSISRQQQPLSMRVRVSLQSGEAETVEDAATGILTAGDVFVSSPVIFAENILNDQQLNPGETIRYGITIQNQTPFTISPLTVIADANYVQGMYWHPYSTVTFHHIAPHSSYVMHYDPLETSSYLTMGSYPTDNGVKTIRVRLADTSGNTWNRIVSWDVQPAPFQPQSIDTLHRVSGIATGCPSALVVDPAQLRGHTYVVQGVDSINSAGEHGITVKDATDGRVLLLNHPLPDSNGFNVPLTDGFQIRRGGLVPLSGRMAGFEYDSGLNWAYGSRTSNPLNLEGFFGAIGNAFEHWPSAGVDFNEQHTILIKFARTDTLGNILDDPAGTVASFGYRYLHHANAPPSRPEFSVFIKNTNAPFAYQDYALSVPFSAYDIDVIPPQRLMVGFTENNSRYGKVDGRYFPPSAEYTAPPDTAADNGAENGPREWFFVFNVPYSVTPDPALQSDIMSQHSPLIWVGYPLRGVNRRAFVPSTFTIIANHAPSANDRWSMTLSRETYLPSTYVLEQNYPNPFNPGTTINYVLAWPGKVTLTIYNLLGQKVRTLKDEAQYAGTFTAQWDGTNDSGTRVATGVYLYRLHVQSMVEMGQSFTETRKMLLLR